MSNIPMWWIYLSGAFLFVNLVFFAILSYVLIQVAKAAQELKPKVDKLTERVDNISEKIDSIATNLDTTVKGLGSKANNVAHSAEVISGLAASSFGKFAPLISAAGTLFKVYQMFKGVRESKKEAETRDTEKALEGRRRSRKGNS